MASAYAFVTLITSDHYLPGALALAAALRDVHPFPAVPPEVDFQTVCLVSPESVDVSSIKLLRKAFDVVIGVELITQENDKGLQLLGMPRFSPLQTLSFDASFYRLLPWPRAISFLLFIPYFKRVSGHMTLPMELGPILIVLPHIPGRPDLNTVLTKLHVFRLTQYSKVIFLDADVLPIRPLSHLFSTPHEFSAAPDVGWPDIFNSGVLVLSPGEEKFSELQQLMKTKGSWDGGDQGLLNEWRGHNWNRLSFTYNTTPTAAYTYAPAYERFGSLISAIHFIGPNKPWKSIPYRAPFASQSSQQSSSPSESQQAYDYNSLLDRWFNVYDKHYRSQSIIPDNEFEVRRYVSAWDEQSGIGAELLASAPAVGPLGGSGSLGLEDLRCLAIEGMNSTGLQPHDQVSGEGEYRSLPLEGRVDLMRPPPPPKQPDSEDILVESSQRRTPGPNSVPPSPLLHSVPLPPSRRPSDTQGGPIEPSRPHYPTSSIIISKAISSSSSSKALSLLTMNATIISLANITKVMAGNITKHRVGNITKVMAGNITNYRAGNITKHRVGNITKHRVGSITKLMVDNIMKVMVANVPKVMVANIPKVMVANIPKVMVANIPKVMVDNITKVAVANIMSPNQGIHTSHDDSHQPQHFENGQRQPEIHRRKEPPRPPSPPKMLWNPAIEPPPTTTPAPDAFPLTRISQMFGINNPAGLTIRFSNSEFLQLSLAHSFNHRLLPRYQSLCFSKAITVSKVKTVFPWEGKPRQRPGRAFPASDQPPPQLFASAVEEAPPIPLPEPAPVPQPISPPPRAQVPAPIHGLPSNLAFANAWDTVPSIQRYASRLVKPPAPPAASPAAFDLVDYRRNRKMSWGERMERSSGDGDDEDNTDDDDEPVAGSFRNVEDSDNETGSPVSTSRTRTPTPRSRNSSISASYTFKGKKKEYRVRGVQTTPREMRSLGIQVSVDLPIKVPPRPSQASPQQEPISPRTRKVSLTLQQGNGKRWTPSLESIALPPVVSTGTGVGTGSPTKGTRSPPTPTQQQQQMLRSPREFEFPDAPALAVPLVVRPVAKTQTQITLSSPPPSSTSPPVIGTGTTPNANAIVNVQAPQQQPVPLTTIVTTGGTATRASVGSPRSSGIVRQASDSSSSVSLPSSTEPVSPSEGPIGVSSINGVDASLTPASPPPRKPVRVFDPARGVDVFKRGSEEVLARFLRMSASSWDEDSVQR
ncbi:hypothetical protein D9758_002278 [Tetrapyrgos nigripes]|uniref:Glycogenin n=1 Tax=Tetrapyrgos nigripes TaxID=182062 RepID=A0A8H5GPK6_9AGAR|nr:hypothetical protein D9758_002278 [Tetrapyrgos nigripes]